MRYLLFVIIFCSSCAASLSPSARTEVQAQIKTQVQEQLAAERRQRAADIQAAVKAGYYGNIVHIFLFAEAAKAGFAITDVDLTEAECVYDICYQGTVTFRRGNVVQSLPLQFFYNGKFWDMNIDYAPLLRRMEELKDREHGGRKGMTLPPAPEPSPGLPGGVL